MTNNGIIEFDKMSERMCAMQKVHITKRDGKGDNSPIIWESDFELPSTIDEWSEYYGSDDKLCDVVLGAEIIKIRAVNDPRRVQRLIVVNGKSYTKQEIDDMAKELAELKSRQNVVNE